MKYAKRNIQTFEPAGPIAQMIRNELRGKSRGAKVKFLEDCVMAKCGLKYPKLAEQFQEVRKAGK